jgi:hypothetical protein
LGSVSDKTPWLFEYGTGRRCELVSSVARGTFWWCLTVHGRSCGQLFQFIISSFLRGSSFSCSCLLRRLRDLMCCGLTSSSWIVNCVACSELIHLPFVQNIASVMAYRSCS